MEGKKYIMNSMEIDESETVMSYTSLLAKGGSPICFSNHHSAVNPFPNKPWFLHV